MIQLKILRVLVHVFSVLSFILLAVKYIFDSSDISLDLLYGGFVLLTNIYILLATYEFKSFRKREIILKRKIKILEKTINYSRE